MQIYKGSAWREISALSVYKSGRWRSIVQIKMYVSGAWREVGNFAPSTSGGGTGGSGGGGGGGGGGSTPSGLTLTITPDPNDATGTSASLQTPLSCVATPTGGRSPYTYAWVRVSGYSSITFSSASTAATKVTATGLTPDVPVSTIVRCTVTDSLGTTATATATVNFDRYTA